MELIVKVNNFKNIKKRDRKKSITINNDLFSLKKNNKNNISNKKQNQEKCVNKTELNIIKNKRYIKEKNSKIYNLNKEVYLKKKVNIISKKIKKCNKIIDNKLNNFNTKLNLYSLERRNKINEEKIKFTIKNSNKFLSNNIKKIKKKRNISKKLIYDSDNIHLKNSRNNILSISHPFNKKEYIEETKYNKINISKENNNIKENKKRKKRKNKINNNNNNNNINEKNVFLKKHKNITYDIKEYNLNENKGDIKKMIKTKKQKVDYFQNNTTFLNKSFKKKYSSCQNSVKNRKNKNIYNIINKLNNNINTLNNNEDISNNNYLEKKLNVTINDSEYNNLEYNNLEYNNNNNFYTKDNLNKNENEKKFFNMENKCILKENIVLNSEKYNYNDLNNNNKNTNYTINLNGKILYANNYIDGKKCSNYTLNNNKIELKNINYIDNIYMNNINENNINNIYINDINSNMGKNLMYTNLNYFSYLPYNNKYYQYNINGINKSTSKNKKNIENYTDSFNKNFVFPYFPFVFYYYEMIYQEKECNLFKIIEYFINFFKEESQKYKIYKFCKLFLNSDLKVRIYYMNTFETLNNCEEDANKFLHILDTVEQNNFNIDFISKILNYSHLIKIIYKIYKKNIEKKLLQINGNKDSNEKKIKERNHSFENIKNNKDINEINIEYDNNILNEYFNENNNDYTIIKNKNIYTDICNSKIILKDRYDQKIVNCFEIKNKNNILTNSDEILNENNNKSLEIDYLKKKENNDKKENQFNVEDINVFNDISFYEKKIFNIFQNAYHNYLLYNDFNKFKIELINNEKKNDENENKTYKETIFSNGKTNDKNIKKEKNYLKILLKNVKIYIEKNILKNVKILNTLSLCKFEDKNFINDKNISIDLYIYIKYEIIKHINKLINQVLILYDFNKFIENNLYIKKNNINLFFSDNENKQQNFNDTKNNNLCNEIIEKHRINEKNFEISQNFQRIYINNEEIINFMNENFGNNLSDIFLKKKFFDIFKNTNNSLFQENKLYNNLFYLNNTNLNKNIFYNKYNFINFNLNLFNKFNNNIIPQNVIMSNMYKQNDSTDNSNFINFNNTVNDKKDLNELNKFHVIHTPVNEDIYKQNYIYKNDNIKKEENYNTLNKYYYLNNFKENTLHNITLNNPFVNYQNMLEKEKELINYNNHDYNVKNVNYSNNINNKNIYDNNYKKNISEVNISEENVTNENIINEDIINKNITNENIINENIINENIMNENFMNENIINQNIINENILNQNIINQNIINENILNQHIINQNVPYTDLINLYHDEYAFEKNYEIIKNHYVNLLNTSNNMHNILTKPQQYTNQINKMDCTHNMNKNIYMNDINYVNHINNINYMNYINNINYMNQINNINYMNQINNINYMNYINNINHNNMNTNIIKPNINKYETYLNNLHGMQNEKVTINSNQNYEIYKNNSIKNILIYNNFKDYNNLYPLINSNNINENINMNENINECENINKNENINIYENINMDYNTNINKNINMDYNTNINENINMNMYNYNNINNGFYKNMNFPFCKKNTFISPKSNIYFNMHPSISPNLNNIKYSNDMNHICQKNNSNTDNYKTDHMLHEIKENKVSNSDPIIENNIDEIIKNKIIKNINIRKTKKKHTRNDIPSAEELHHLHYSQKLSIPQIASIFGVHRTTVSRWFHNKNIKPKILYKKKSKNKFNE